jgi:pimeloyl-ACP methyl ester carboxylesterase
MRRPLDSSCPRIARAWTQWMPYRAGRYRGIRIDMPGFGASTAPDGSIRCARKRLKHRGAGWRS